MPIKRKKDKYVQNIDKVFLKNRYSYRNDILTKKDILTEKIFLQKRYSHRKGLLTGSGIPRVNTLTILIDTRDLSMTFSTLVLTFHFKFELCNFIIYTSIVA